jgi:hypothetical protein
MAFVSAIGPAICTHRLVNFDGLVILSTGDDPSDPKPSYTQVFRNGAMEGAVQIEWPEGKLQASLIEKYLVPGIRNYLAALQRFDIASPVAILVSLLNVKGKIMESGVDGLHAHLGSLPIREEHLIFGELVVHDLPKDEQEFSHTLSPLVDQIWNIAGFSVRPSWLSRW